MSVLDEIIVGVKADLASRIATVPFDEVKDQALSAAPALDALNYLRQPGVSLIAEVKRSSPSKGALADIADPAELAAAYEAGGASIVSVLTEERRFSGTLADLDAVRQRVGIPVLRKDFMVSEYQIWEARAHGADVILLIVAALTDEELQHFHSLATSLGMAVLVEVHDQDEVRRANDLGAQIVGVNARNLKTLEVHRDTFALLKPLIAKGALTVAESGIQGPEDVRYFGQLGADAVLVGESLVKGSDPQAAAASLVAAGKN